MLGLPKSTEINKPLAKKAIFNKFKPSPADRKLFDEQINRLAIVAEISPQTVAISAGIDVSAIYVILVSLKTANCDKRNITLLSKLINQRMLFVLQYNSSVQLAVYRAGQVLFSEGKQMDDWKLTLSGLDFDSVWENIIAQIGSIDLSGGKDLEEAIIEKVRREKLKKQIELLEKKAMSEKQPRKKWELVEEITQLRREFEN
jgi:hypothetical protein